MELAALGQTFVLRAALLALPDFKENLLRGNAEHPRYGAQRLLQALARLVRVDALRRRILLHVRPARRAPVQIDGERVLRHVGIVETIAADALALRPLPELLQVLAQAVGEP